jgi:hypothetical protein
MPRTACSSRRRCRSARTKPTSRAKADQPLVSLDHAPAGVAAAGFYSSFHNRFCEFRGLSHVRGLPRRPGPPTLVLPTGGRRMANNEQLARLMKGVDAWNAWRRENQPVRVDLRRADLSGADLEAATADRGEPVALDHRCLGGGAGTGFPVPRPLAPGSRRQALTSSLTSEQPFQHCASRRSTSSNISLHLDMLSGIYFRDSHL